MLVREIVLLMYTQVQVPVSKPKIFKGGTILLCIGGTTVLGNSRYDSANNMLMWTERCYQVK